MSNFNPNPILLTFFKNWMSLENLAFWEKGQEYLLGNNQTNCKNKSVTNCGQNNKCGVYKDKKCVSKNTIHHFVEGETIKNQIFGKKYLIKSIYIPDEVLNKIKLDKVISDQIKIFRLLLRQSKQKDIIDRINYNRELFISLLKEHQLINNINGNNINDNKIYDILKNLSENTDKYNRLIKDFFTIVFQKDFNENKNTFVKNYEFNTILSSDDNQKLFFYVFNEIESRNVYLIFPAGDVLHSLYNSEFFLNIYFNYVIEYIKQLDADNIILGGHSMGCVYAQFIGNKLLKENRDLFESKIWIVGTAPFKWIKPEDIELYNIYFFKKILIFGLVKEDVIDSFLLKGNNNLFQSNIYILYFLYEGSRSKGFLPVIDSEKSNLYSLDDIIKKIEDKKWFINEDETSSIHNFHTYHKVITKFLQLNKQEGGKYKNRYISKYLIKYNDKNAVIYEASGGSISKKPENYQKIVKKFKFDKVKRIPNGLEFNIKNKTIKITNEK